MFKRPSRVLFLILIIGFFAGILSLPENYNIKTKLLGKPVNFTVNPPSLNFNFFNLPIRKDFKTRLGLDLAGGTHIVLEADMKDIADSNRNSALESAKEIIDRRVNFFGVSEPIVQTARSNNSYRIIVELPGVTNTDQAVKTIGQTAKLEFREFTDNAESSPGAFIIPTLENTKSTGLTGKDLKKAQLSFSSQTGEPEVFIQFTSAGAKKFGNITTRLTGKNLPIFLDNFPLTWPQIKGPITSGEGVITGGFTQEVAKTLALQLNAGALPVPVRIVEKRTVGATLGQESIKRSIDAGVVGLSLVGVYMVLLYGKLGILASIALILYGLITFAIFRLIPVTLTLPGVAGFFLSIGMAVDANILIFERFKEEKRMGKPWRIAMELGFGKAWDSIRDANVTTIVTSLILYNPANWQFLPSSGLVRGFAATLLIGVLVGLFTGIVVSRTLIRIFYRPGRSEK